MHNANCGVPIIDLRKDTCRIFLFAVAPRIRGARTNSCRERHEFQFPGTDFSAVTEFSPLSTLPGPPRATLLDEDEMYTWNEKLTSKQ